MDVPSTYHAERWVAIVDDDAAIRRALARLLRANGIDGKTFASVRDYFSHAPAEAPVCVIVDSHIRGGMSGLELTQRLRAQGVAPPIIFITGQDEQELRTLRDGAPDSTVLRKPFDARVLLELVARHIGGASSHVVR